MAIINNTIDRNRDAPAIIAVAVVAVFISSASSRIFSAILLVSGVSSCECITGNTIAIINITNIIFFIMYFISYPLYVRNLFAFIVCAGAASTAAAVVAFAPCQTVGAGIFIIPAAVAAGAFGVAVASVSYLPIGACDCIPIII